MYVDWTFLDWQLEYDEIECVCVWRPVILNKSSLRMFHDYDDDADELITIEKEPTEEAKIQRIASYRALAHFGS